MPNFRVIMYLPINLRTKATVPNVVKMTVTATIADCRLLSTAPSAVDAMVKYKND